MFFLFSVLQPAAVGRPYLPTQGSSVREDLFPSGRVSSSPAGMMLGRGSPVGGGGSYGYMSSAPATPTTGLTPPPLPPHYRPAVSRTTSMSYTPPGSLMPSDIFSPPPPPMARGLGAQNMPSGKVPSGIQLPPGVFALFDK